MQERDLEPASGLERAPLLANGLRRELENAERFPFRLCIEAGDRAPQRQRLLPVETEALRNHRGPQGQHGGRG